MRSKDDLFSIFQMHCSSRSFVLTTSLFLIDLCFMLYLNYFCKWTVNFCQSFWYRCTHEGENTEKDFLKLLKVQYIPLRTLKWMYTTQRGEMESPGIHLGLCYGSNCFRLLYIFSHFADAFIQSNLQVRNTCNLWFSVLPKDTSTWRLEDPGTELQTLRFMRLVDNPVYLLNHSCYILNDYNMVN